MGQSEKDKLLFQTFVFHCNSQHWFDYTTGWVICQTILIYKRKKKCKCPKLKTNRDFSEVTENYHPWFQCKQSWQSVSKCMCMCRQCRGQAAVSWSCRFVLSVVETVLMGIQKADEDHRSGPPAKMASLLTFAGLLDEELFTACWPEYNHGRIANKNEIQMTACSTRKRSGNGKIVFTVMSNRGGPRGGGLGRRRRKSTWMEFSWRLGSGYV